MKLYLNTNIKNNLKGVWFSPDWIQICEKNKNTCYEIDATIGSDGGDNAKYRCKGDLRFFNSGRELSFLDFSRIKNLLEKKKATVLVGMYPNHLNEKDFKILDAVEFKSCEGMLEFYNPKTSKLESVEFKYKVEVNIWA